MAAPAGWYTDPQDTQMLRWWDGAGWTEHRQQAPSAAPSPSPPHPAASVPPASVHAPMPYLEPGMVNAMHAPQTANTAVPSGLLDQQRSGLFGKRQQLEMENERLRQALGSLGVAERDQLKAEADGLRREIDALRHERARLQQEVVETRDDAILQEVGVYRYSHPLDSAATYKAQLDGLKASIGQAARTGTAISSTTTWQVNGSAAEGRKMVTDISKLLLRAYNNEADTAVRGLKPYALPRAVERLDKSRAAISRLGRSMSIEVTDYYHQLRLHELRLTADFLAKQAEEKEREREARARLREEEQVRREIEREQARLQKEREHYFRALDRLRSGTADPQAIAELEQQLASVDASIRDVEQRAANVRAGYVYVISNIGAFGPSMVKVGMTRRLDPQDRVRELGDASVPFLFDTHALVFSNDAVALEQQLHRALETRRVNRVNTRREFFNATPAEVRELLGQFKGAELSFVEQPEALEWHQSVNMSRSG